MEHSKFWQRSDILIILNRQQNLIWQRLSNYYDHPPVLRLYLSIDPCLDVGKSHATNDEQLLAVSLIGTILQKSDFIADPVVASGDSFRSTEKRSLTVKSRYVINVKDMGFNYCGFIYLITQLDTHNIHDLDSTNNIIIKQVCCLLNKND